MYVLNKQQVIKQKIDACERPPIQMIWDHGKTNSVIKFSAASFELLVGILIKHLEKRVLCHSNSKNR